MTEKKKNEISENSYQKKAKIEVRELDLLVHKYKYFHNKFIKDSEKILDRMNKLMEYMELE